MTRLVIALALATVFGCPGKGNQPTTTTTGTGDPTAPVAKRILVSWGVQPADQQMTDVFLALTDETGKVVSHPLGRWKGSCTPGTPAPEMKALTALVCRTGGTGTELHAVTQGGAEIIVLYMRFDEGVTPDPMAREEVKRIKVPVGAAIEAGG
jgi:hypothetical protein